MELKKNMFDWLKLYFHFANLFLIVFIVFYGCANISQNLTGGPKDETPPTIVKSKPKNLSTNFSGKKIEVDFDEYIQLKDVNNKLIISPPLEKRPEIINTGRGIEVTIKEDLDSATTYTFNFSDAIVDNNEGNAIPKFEFIFSTGNYIDSLFYTGKVIDAFTNKPVEGVFALLYDDLKDSVPLLKKPYYVSRTDTSGRFIINHMKLDTFKLFILKDANFNYIYDSPDELIAFADSFIFFHPTHIEYSDTIFYNDSTHTDSIVEYNYDTHMAKEEVVYLFKEEIKLQYLTDNNRPAKNKLSFKFNRPIFDSISIFPVYVTPDEYWYIPEISTDNQTVEFWLTDTTIINIDTLRLAVNYSILDSANNLTLKTDTVLMRFQEKEDRKKKRNKEEEIDSIPVITYLNINRAGSGNVELNGPFTFISPTPIANIEISKIHLYEMEDTIPIEKEFVFKWDSIHIRKYHIEYTWKEETTYKMFIEPYAFTDVYGFYNDTIINTFVSKTLDSYGNIFLNVNNINAPVVIQLIDNKENIILEKQCFSNVRIEFSYLKPAEYGIKLIYDTNENGIWDTGDYLQKKQPENVLYFNKKLNVRANWDIEETWDIGSD